MAYRIDFTESNYVKRSWRKTFLRLLAVAAVAGAVWEVHYVYKIYNQPTLNMKLAEFESVARPIEEMNAAWDVAAKEFGAMVRYYRLIWASNPTNFLSAMASPDSPHLGRGFRPLRWTLKTGGKCRLDYLYTFRAGDKAEQAKGLEDVVANAVTSVVKVVGGKVDVQGVQHENLLRVDSFNVTAAFSLPDVMSFPAKERVLSGCVNEIAAMRSKVQDSKIVDTSDARGIPAAAKGMMMEYLKIGKDKPDFPGFADVIDVGGWFVRADKFIAKNKMPDDPARKRIRERWDRIGNARFPWARYRALDNDELAARTVALADVSDGVKKFKGFLEKCHADCRKKLEPFIEAYNRNDVFNKPLVESDLKDRVAKASGITAANTSFKDEPGAEPAVLVKEDGTFTFTWVRWTLSVGGGADKDRKPAGETAAPEDPITLEKLSDCVRRTLKLGPGYVLDTLKIEFREDGNVSGAVLEGLLPVKKMETAKEAAGNVG